jgi:predicted ATPase/class 3 adenylate cyclase
MTTPSEHRFGDVLRQQRLAAQLTRAELAERATLSVRAVNDLERGARTAPRLETVRLLANALSLDGDERAQFFAAARSIRHSSASDQRPDKETAAPIVSAPPPLPSGTVTFLFSDIEGSTQTLQRIGASGYARVLGESQEILRGVWAAHEGAEVDTAGDGFFVAFSSAPQAVAAAAAAIRALAEHPWPARSAIRVRIGMHTGAPQLVGDHYVGLDVHRAARIASAGHGGQALLSESTRALVEHDLPKGVVLHDLGPQRLKDLQHAEQIYQLVLAGLPAEFPALKTLDRHAHNLPVQPTPLVGRDEALAAVCALLRDDNTRLVTLTGPGGVGKTRLSLQVAAELVDVFADGVWFTRLSRLSDASLVLPTIGATLGLSEAATQSMAQTLSAYLHERQVLLVLDNFEQLVAAAPDIAALLEAAPHLKLLVTSRVSVRLRGEQEYPLTPLALPDAHQLPSPDRLSQYAAVALFIERAGEARPDFSVTSANAPAIAEICARLDGLPLAIELAAVRVKLLPPEALLARLSNQLKLLTGGARDLEARQQTMRATIAWSEHLLSSSERTLFRRLAVFVGGATLEAVEAVCVAPDGAALLDSDALDALGALVDHSLVQQREEGGQSRFGMLHVIHEYALEQLEASGEAAALYGAHADFFLAMAEHFDVARRRPGYSELMANMARDLDNFRAALEWGFEHGAPVLAARMNVALGSFWQVHGHWIEGRRWNERTLRIRHLLPPNLYATLQYWDDALARGQGGWPAATSTLEASLELARTLDDRENMRNLLYSLGSMALGQERFDEAGDRFSECVKLFQEAHVRDGLTDVLRMQAAVAYDRGKYDEEQRLVEQALALAHELGDTHDVADCTARLGWRALLDGHADSAEARLQEALAIQQGIGDKNCSALSLRTLGIIALEQEQIVSALDQIERSIALHQEIAAQPSIADSLIVLAEVRLASGDQSAAEEACQASLRILQRIKSCRHTANALETLAQVTFARGQLERTAFLLGAREATLSDLVPMPWPPRITAQHAQTVAETREALGDKVWAAAYRAGQTLTLDEAISKALASG